MPLVILFALLLGAGAACAALFLPVAVAAVLLTVGGIATLLGWLLIRVANEEHGSGAIGLGIVALLFLGGGIPLVIGSAIGLLLR